MSETVDLEALFDRFRLICITLENGDHTLEEAVTLHAQGTEISLRIRAELDRAERRVVEVIGQDGVVRPFDGGRARK